MSVKVSFFTGDIKNAGTSANIYLKLYFIDADTAEKHALLIDPFHGSENNNFKRNTIVTFPITQFLKNKLLYAIHIHHDNSGKSPDWFLSKVVFDDKNNNKTLVFPYNNWLSIDAPPYSVECTLTEQDFTNSNPSSFISFTSKGELDTETSLMLDKAARFALGKISLCNL